MATEHNGAGACRFCGGALPPIGEKGGRPRDYCCDAHKMRAYRARNRRVGIDGAVRVAQESVRAAHGRDRFLS